MKNDEMMKENDDFLKMKTTLSLYEISAFKNLSTQIKE